LCESDHDHEVGQVTPEGHLPVGGVLVHEFSQQRPVRSFHHCEVEQPPPVVDSHLHELVL
jgi:hypothetical protein